MASEAKNSEILQNQSLCVTQTDDEKTPLLYNTLADKRTKFYSAIKSWFQSSGPDGLEAWGVAFAAAFINFIMAGINRASAILYVEFIDAFQTDRMQASLPFSIRSLTRNLSGPVVGIFGQKYGVRPAILVGGIIGTLSTIACFFVADIFWTSVFWGCFSGFGAALIMTLGQAAINQHFKKHLSTASGIALSGGCFGSLVFPAMFESLIEEYTIQGTFLFIAGMIMHVIPAAIILKKPTWLKNQPRIENEILVNGNINSYVEAIDSKTTMISNANETSQLVRNSEIAFDTVNLKENKQCFSEKMTQNLGKKIDTDLLLKNKELVINLLTNDNSVRNILLDILQTESFQEDSQIKEITETFCTVAKEIRSDSATEESFDNINITTTNNASEDIAFEDSDMLYINRHSNVHLTETTEFYLNPADCLRLFLEKFFQRDKEDISQSFPQEGNENLNKIYDELKHIYFILENNRCSEYECNKLHDSQIIHKNLSSVQCNPEQSNTFCFHIKTAMWLHTKPLFLLTCLCRCVHFITFMPILTTVVDFSRDKGLPGEYGKYAIGTIAIGDLVGRLSFGWLTDKEYLTLPKYMCIFMVLQGIFTIALALTNSKESLLSVLAVYGLLQGCTFVRHPVLISHYMGKDEQSIALGCLNFFPGIIGIAMPFYIGYFRDIIGSYNGIFYINGSIGCFIGFLWLAEPYLLKCSLRFPQRKQHVQV